MSETARPAGSAPPAPSPLLLISASDTDADLLWATRFLVSDPVVCLRTDSETILLVSDLELGRARTEARVDRIVSTSGYEAELRRAETVPDLIAVVTAFLRDEGIEEVFVPPRFSLSLAERLRDRGIRITCARGPVFPDRSRKTEAEVDAIHEVQRAAEACMQRVIDRIADSEIRDGLLWSAGRPLTAEELRREGQRLLIDRDCLAVQMIIAPGDQGCDPHQRGSGQLPAHETIVIDIFPQSMPTRYWGDITRTVVRGTARPDVHRLYRDVLDAQMLGLSRLRPGAHGREVHEAVAELLRSRGNENGEEDGKKTGFFHGTGHGVGLDIHELPRVSRIGTPLEAGHVVTVEPGLYYPGRGAVRIEDLVVITDEGARNLTTFPKDPDTLEV